MPNKESENCGLAVASLVLSLAALIIGPFGFVSGIVCGHLAKARLRKEPALGGRGMATAGLALGYGLGLLMITAGILFGVWLVRSNAALKAPIASEVAPTPRSPGPGRPNRPAIPPPRTRPVAPADVEVSGLTIPDSPVSGKLRGQDFACDTAIIENGMLKLRQGSSTPPDGEVVISLFLSPGESPAGKSWDTSKPSAGPIPHIQTNVKSPTANGRSRRRYTTGFGLRLEFGSERDGKIDGKIYARFPGASKDYIAGTFSADLPKPTAKPNEA
jgi:hypothetical protein